MRENFFFFLTEPAGNLSSHKALKIPRILTRTRDLRQATVSCGILVMFLFDNISSSQSSSDFHSLKRGHLPELLFILDAPNLLAQSIGEQVVSGQTSDDPGDGVGSASGCIPPRVRVALL